MNIFDQIALLALKETQKYGSWKMQDHRGMHRICELDLLGQIASDIGAKCYIELGCGQGYGLNAVKVEFPTTQVVGYESHVAESNLPPEITATIHSMDIFSPEFTQSVEQYVNTKPLFIYTDNGHKLRELHMMAKYIKRGDILGTHDWPNEVGDEQVLLEMGFVVADEYEPYIKKYLSLQRFWKRQ